MAVSTRQSNLFAAEDWKKLYSTFRTADFQSYDFETLRKSMVDYLRTYYPEDFNDYIESSEFVALLDLMAFMGQSITFRSDLNARENFMETAERRDSVYRLAKLLGYSPNRTKAASGLIKVVSVTTTETVRDSSGRNLANAPIFWDDPTNIDWFEQFTAIMNAALQPSQRVGRPTGTVTIGSVRHDLYQLRLRDNIVPVFSFSSTANGSSYPFEVYSVELDANKGVREASPAPSDSLGMVFRNDGRGNASVNTGFFLAFKQGTLTNLDFTITESLANRIVGLNVNNINNEDVWLFETNNAGVYTNEWTQVPSLRDSNVIYNAESSSNRNLYSVTSRASDQIDLVFGDGVFTNIPVGTYRAVVRISNGLTYSISPQEMRNVPINIPYISRSGKIESLIIRANLQYTVSNASARETLADVKEKAPQYYYTQNRMVNGEDYNTLPNTKFTDIAKVKSVNRTASGLSRFLDITDPTSKYSSTNFFGDDGYLYKEEDEVINEFTWNTASDIQRYIRGELSESIRSKESLNLYYARYAKNPLPSTLIWKRVIAENDACNGYFAIIDDNDEYAPQSIGEVASGNRIYMRPGSLIKMEAPAGKYFDIDRSLKTGTPTLAGHRTYIWVTVLSTVDDGTAAGKGVLSTGNGPVVLNENIPTDARATYVYAPYGQTISSTLEQQILSQMLNNANFGLRYDINAREWKIITANNLMFESRTPIDVTSGGNTSGTNSDNSWFIAFINPDSGSSTAVSQTTYQVYRRRLNYYFGSVKGTRFYFDSRTRIYDTRTSSLVTDSIKVLRSNSLPDSADLLSTDYVWTVYDAVTYSDGYKDDTLIKVTLSDSDDDGVPDDPEIFDILVNEGTNAELKKVYQEKYLDYDNLDRFAWISPESISRSYATLGDIEVNGINANPLGTVFYATDEDKFYKSELFDNVRRIVETTDYRLYTGRSDFYFQYKHNAPSDRRIDPTPTNIIDMFILPTSYDTEYRRWIADTTGTVTEPVATSVVDLSLAYSDLEMFKSVSDAIIYNPARYRPLFGSKAETSLQAMFKIVKTTASKLSPNELRSKVITTIDEYFALENWDFGDTFYYSELAAYIHNKMAPDLATVVIVPKDSTLNFGSLFQITSLPNEIFISAATVDDVEIVDSLTANKLQVANGGAIFTGTQASLGSNT